MFNESMSPAEFEAWVEEMEAEYNESCESTSFVVAPPLSYLPEDHSNPNFKSFGAENDMFSF